MTNGEKIQQDFKCEVCEPIIEDNIIHVIFADKPDSAIGFDWDWWNAEYKEPTTKNNLGVDLISRADALDCVNWGITFSDVYKKINDLPSVTPQEPMVIPISEFKFDVDKLKELVDRAVLTVAPHEPRWIPISERLPDANIYDGHGPVWKHEVLITGYLSYDDKKETFVNMAFAEDVRNKCVPNTNVIAWMPLPTPYEPRESEEI